MPSIKDLKKRISTVKNTQQTTRAMKMVSAAKLRRAQEAVLSQRPYAKRLDQMMRKIAALQGEVSSPLLRREGASAERKVLLVLVTSDRGLCGGFNSNAIKAANRWMKANQTEYSQITLGFVGRKGFDFFKTKKISLGPNFAHAAGKVTFQKATELAKALQELYLSGQFDEIKIVYSEFKNAVSQRLMVEDFLPLLPPQVEGVAVEELKEVLVKPSSKELLDALLTKQFAVQAFRVLLESQASEHGARMSAMENATKNAGEMLRKLTLNYNKQRQAGITKELLEIISGSESQKGTG